MRTRLSRRLSLEQLEKRNLLAADISLGLGSTSATPGEEISLAVELNLPNPSPAEAEGAALAAMLDGLHVSIVDIPVKSIRNSQTIDGELYTVGSSDRRAVAHQLDLNTGEARLIELQHPIQPDGGSGFAYGIAKVLGGVTFSGIGNSRALTWDIDGNPAEAPLIPDFPSSHGVVRDVTSDGFMTGQLSSVAVAWNSLGDAIELPRTELSDALGESSSGLAMTNDGRLIVGDIGGIGTAWEALGNPADGNYVLREYGYDDLFTYAMQNGPGGSAPESSQFVLNSEVFGSIMFAAYQTPNGVMNGAWNIDDGSFIRNFGPGHAQDVFEHDGNIIVISNDTDLEKSGVLWSFTDPDPLYLKDVLVGEGIEEPYFTRGGLFQTEGGFGIVGSGTVDGETIHFIGEVKDASDPDPETPPGDIVLDISPTTRGASVALTIEVNVSGSSANSQGDSAGTSFWDGFVQNGEVASMVFPLRNITKTVIVGDHAYTLGNDSQGLLAGAFKWNWQEASGEEIVLPNLSSLNGTGLGTGYAYDLIEDSKGVVFVGESSYFDNGIRRSTIWRDGAPDQAALIPGLRSSGGNIFQIFTNGAMVGEQEIYGVAWNPNGEPFLLPRGVAEALDFGSSAGAMTVNYIVGSIGGLAAAWEIIADGTFQLKEYEHDEFFSYSFQVGPNGSAPDVAPFVLDTDAFGTIMFSNYFTPEGTRSGAWSVEDGTFLVGFDGEIMDVLKDATGTIIVAANDVSGTGSGVLYSLEGDALYLKDLVGEEGPQNPFITPGGLFETETGFGIVGRGTVGGEAMNFVSLLDREASDAVYEFFIDSTGDGIFDLTLEGPSGTEASLSFETSGSYTIRVQARRDGELIAEGTTTVDVAPTLPGVGKVDFAPMDMSGDGLLTPLDALLVINQIARVNRGAELDLRFDVNGDGAVTPMDALLVLNQVRIGGSGQAIPVVRLQNDSGVPGDGLTNDLSLEGTVPAEGPLFVSFGDEVREISHARGVDGVFSLSQDEMEEVFGPFADGDHEFRLWSGAVDTRNELKTRVNVAYDATPPADFALHLPVLREDGTRRLRWDVAIGASRYQVFIKSGGDADFSPLGEERRTEFLTLESLASGSHEAYVLAWDAAGNSTESSPIQFAI